MKRFAVTLVLGLSLVALSACQQQSPETNKKLDEILARLEKIEKARPAAAAPGRPPTPDANRPDPSAVYAVPVDGSPFVGAKDAKVTIVKAYEYACPFCLRVNPTLDQLIKDYPNEVKVVYKQFVVHPQTATLPALATCAAHRQGKFKEMDTGLWEKGFNANRDFSEANIEKIAKEVGLNVDKFKADMKGDECKKAIEKEQSELAAVGTRGTPNFYINGRPLSGAQPLPNFKKIVDEELAKANERIKGGSKLESYYTEWVVGKGKKSM